MWPALARSFDAFPSGHPRRLRELLEANGGFTVTLGSGKTVRSGISVAARPSRSLRFERGAWCDRTVDEWMQSIAAEPTWPGRRVGGWVDPVSGAVSLDIVLVIPRLMRSVAVVLGRATNQQCIFDLTRNETMVLR